ncbi:DoxX family membrane protein [Flagellimonas pacifica]|uniref:DoxX protein n=1 Tax=Flagellimonas pacifica TaxID=1247520 RepID=A0A285MYD5_9FLAO|nr:DoxX family membrane protein [Allomuricauda parva]SNZ01557.1 DoxX protein [Allomuricauda parva]
MNSKVFLVARILLGLFVLFFGLNKFFGFLEFGEMPEAAMNYFAGVGPTQVLKIVGVIEILAGLSFILNKYGALMALILMSISVNAVLFHATLHPAEIMGALILIILNIVVLIGYKDRYKEILRA